MRNQSGLYSQLPKPDTFGNYWFGNKYNDPVIFLKTYGKSMEDEPSYMLSLGSDGVVFASGQIREFASAEGALRHLRKHLKEVQS